jgi:hypothetical protein
MEKTSYVVTAERKESMEKPKVNFQGKIEIMESSVRGMYLVKYPGKATVELYRGKNATEKAIKKWANENAKNAVNFALAEWGSF